jgi:hypothetical protein
MDPIGGSMSSKEKERLGRSNQHSEFRQQDFSDREKRNDRQRHDA